MDVYCGNSHHWKTHLFPIAVNLLSYKDFIHSSCKTMAQTKQFPHSNGCQWKSFPRVTVAPHLHFLPHMLGNSIMLCKSYMDHAQCLTLYAGTVTICAVGVNGGYLAEYTRSSSSHPTPPPVFDPSPNMLFPVCADTCRKVTSLPSSCTIRACHGSHPF